MITLNQKLNKEFNDLQTKIYKLDDFIMDNPAYLKLTRAHQKLLLDQFYHMKSYLSVLNQRIKLLLD